MNDEAREKLKTLTEFLQSDPENPALLADVAEALLGIDECAIAHSTYKQLKTIEPLSGQLANMAGIAAMRSGDQEAAQGWFAIAQEDNPEDQSLTFNRAWNLALSGDQEASTALLSDDLTDALPQAALLDMQIAHDQGRFEDAAAKVEGYLSKHPDYAPLQAAALVLAMDVDCPELAKEAALRGGNHPDALTTLGSLNLGEHKLDEADAHFEQALASGHANPKAQIGRGLVALARQDYARAAADIDQGAAQFGEHLGSWIAAGWAHLLAGDQERARERFETALETDDTFAESHGALAVMDALSGDMEAAQRKAEIAMRLDRASFGAALAGVLMANAEGDGETAQRIFEKAMEVSVLPGGGSLEGAIIRSVMNKGVGPADRK